MDEKRGITMEEVEQTDKQIWTQQNCKHNLGVGLTTNSIDSELRLCVGEQ
jgi:hypothetical protein